MSTFAHVLANGNFDEAVNLIDGTDENPKGGTQSAPVAKIKISLIVESV